MTTRAHNVTASMSPLPPLTQAHTHMLCSAAGLLPCAFAGAVPNNINRQLEGLLQEVQAENQAMVGGGTDWGLGLCAC